jgi:type II protein arginine methyltransferase
MLTTSAALEIPRELPPLALQSRWYSEPVRLLMYPRTSFIRNAKGNPVLSKQHQQYLTLFLRLRFPPWALLSDVGVIPASDDMDRKSTNPEPTPAEAATRASESPTDPLMHLRYMRHLQKTQPSRPPIERFGQGYQDYMQSPLQPLTDNLESITYEVFEKDPVKYEWYERAIALALKDLRTRLGPDRKIVVAVVGSGRGPLVTRALQASRSTGIEISAYAVEKNPHAYVLLQHRNATDSLWNNRVTVVKSDMRTWPGPKAAGDDAGKVDILVSELLGSFADNELSPECLDGVQHVLHPEHGINIPQNYSAHFTPIASPRLHGDLVARASTDLDMSVKEKWELPYVVMLHQYDYLSTLPQSAEDQRTPDVREVWSFSHPVPEAILDQARARQGGTVDAGGLSGGDGTNEHNNRSCSVRFTCASRGVCHGLAGYFETVLYSSADLKQTIELSTNPVTMVDKSKDMISWFPIFFPLKTPVYVPDGAEMEVSMWRQTDDRKVWYEWVVEVFVQLDGRRVKVGGSELHSSKKNGCLM